MMKNIADIEEDLRMRESVLDESVAFWETRIEQAMERHNDAQSCFDDEALEAAEDELRLLYSRAMIEKKESIKLEKEISRFCAFQAFKKTKEKE